MPLIGTTGAASARGFGFGLPGASATYWFASGGSFDCITATEDDGSTFILSGGNALTKLSPTGSVLWSRTINFSDAISQITMESMVRDSTGAVLICGRYQATGSINFSFLLKISSSGSLTFNRRFIRPSGQSGSIELTGIGIDTSDNIYVSGGGTNFNSGETGLVFQKFSSSGTSQWTRFYPSSAQAARAIGATNYYVIASTFTGRLCLLDPGTGAMDDMQSNPSVGVFDSDDRPSCTRDSSGNIYTAFKGSTSGRIVATKVGLFGSKAWTKDVDASVSTTSRFCSATDLSGNMYLDTRTGTTVGDFTKLDSSGSFLFRRTVGGFGSSTTNLSSSPNGLFYSAGEIAGDACLLPGNGTKTGTYGGTVYGTGSTPSITNAGGWSSESVPSSSTVYWEATSTTNITLTNRTSPFTLVTFT